MGAGSSVHAGDSNNALEAWTKEQVCTWLHHELVANIEDRFRNANVDGHELVKMTDANAVAKILKVDKAHATSIALYIKPLLGSVGPGVVNQASNYSGAPLAAKTDIDDFEIIKRLGKGAFGDVWMATNKFNGLSYAIKMLDKAHVQETESLDLVVREKELLALMHDPQPCPFIVQLHFGFQDHKRLYLALSLVTGGELYQNLQAMPNKRFDIPSCQFYIAEIILALEWMHNKRVAYRDLKAENVLIDADGHIVITDLGLAKQWESGSIDLHSTSMIGTPEYMPPEVIRENPHGTGFDFWTLGILFFEMMVGQTPFRSDNAQGLFVNILMNSPNFPAFVPESAQDLVSGFLEKSPEARLGGESAGGFAAVKQHPFFHDLNWADASEKKLIPPRQPYVKPTTSDTEPEVLQPDEGDAFSEFQDFVSDKHQQEVQEALEAQAKEKQLQVEAEEAEKTQAASAVVADESFAADEDEFEGNEIDLTDHQKVKRLERRQSRLITDYEVMSKRLESREHALDLVLNLVPQLICAKDAKGNYILANKKMSALYKMSPKELEGKNQMDVATSAAEARKMLDVDRAVIEAGTKNVNILCLKQEFGGSKIAPKTLKITKIPYKQSGNGEDAVMAIADDISEYIEKEKRIKEQMETLQLNNSKLKDEKELLEQKLAMYKYLAEEKNGALKDAGE